MNKKKFNIKDYKLNYVMHCDSPEKAKIFVEYLDDLGYSWRTGCEYKASTNWNEYEESTVYHFLDGYYGKLDNAIEYGYNILEFDDFDWGEENSPKEDSIQEALQKVEDAKQKEAHNFLSKNSMVEHPKHYNRKGGMECIDEMELIFGVEETMAFCKLNAWKYRYRSADKDKEQDLEKSDYYLKVYKRLKEKL